MRPPFRLAVWCVAVACAAGLAACGGSAHHRTLNRHKVPVRAQTVAVYSSLPLVGPSAWMGRAVKRGIELALAQAGGRTDDFIVRYRSLNDARFGDGPWDAGSVAANARSAAVDPAAVAYIGDLDPGAARISLPILNQAGIPQISPWSPYVGLTRAVGGDVTAPGEPARYHPTSTRTFLRLAPGDAVQAAALLTAAREADCSRLAVLRSGSTHDLSDELGGLLGLARPRFAVRIVSNATLPGALGSGTAVSPTLALRRYVASVRAADTGCLAYLGSPSASAASAIAAVHAELPRAPLFGSDRVCQAAFRGGPLRRQLAGAGGGFLQCTLPALPPNGSASGHFEALWQTEFGVPSPAGPWAAYGYEAMRLVLAEMNRLGPQGDQRERLLRALFAAQRRGTVLSDYSFNPSGDSTVRAYGLWEVRSSGPPRLVRVMQPPPS